MIVILPESYQIGPVKYVIMRIDRTENEFIMRHLNVRDIKFTLVARGFNTIPHQPVDDIS